MTISGPGNKQGISDLEKDVQCRRIGDGITPVKKHPDQGGKSAAGTSYPDDSDSNPRKCSTQNGDTVDGSFPIDL